MDDATLRNQIGSNIAAYRKQAGLTQAGLAEKLNYSDKAVSKWERDLACPDIHTLPALAEALGLSVDELMQGKRGRLSENGRTGVILNTMFRGVALAMGVAVAVLSILKALEGRDAMVMLGIGLACLAASTLGKDVPA